MEKKRSLCRTYLDSLFEDLCKLSNSGCPTYGTYSELLASLTLAFLLGFISEYERTSLVELAYVIAYEF